MRKSAIRRYLPVCVALILLMCILTGCGGADKEEAAPTLEPTTVSTEAVQTEAPTEAEVQTEAPTEAAPQTEAHTEAEVPSETANIEQMEDEVGSETETIGGMVTEPEQETQPTETQPVQPPVETEETVRKELYDELQSKLTDLEAQQEKTHRRLIIAVCVAGFFLLLAVLFFLIWRVADKKLRKRKRKAEVGTPVSKVVVGKAHGIGQRSSQQDSFSVSAEEGYPNTGVFAVVADGMGGLKDGDKISQTAVMSAVEHFYSSPGYGPEKIVRILSGAKDGVDNLLASGQVDKGGTTLLLGLLQNSQFYYASIGDSRICLFRNGELIGLNREHTYLNELLRRVVNGEMDISDAYTDKEASCITSYLGMSTVSKVDLPANSVPAMAGDKFILMSDGVFNALTHQELTMALRHPATEAAAAIESFIHTKNYPNQDNYTVVILQCL